MNKAPLLLFAFIVLLASFCSASLSDGIIHAWPLNYTYYNDVIGTANLADNSTDTSIGKNPAGILNRHLNYYNAKLNAPLDIPDNFTLSFWMNKTSNPFTNYWGYYAGANDSLQFCGYSDDCGGDVACIDGTETFSIGRSDIMLGYENLCIYGVQLNKMNHWVISMNRTNMTVFINGVINNSRAIALVSVGYELTNMTFGGVNAAYNANAVFDEIYMWNRVLTAAEVTSLYNGGTGSFYPAFAASGFFNIQLLGSNNTYNTTRLQTIPFNASYIIIDGNWSQCSIWSNYTGNWEANSSNTTKITNNTAYGIAWDTKKDGNWIYNIGCNSTNKNTSFAQYNFTLKVDSVSPVLNISSPANNSVINSTLQLNISCSDSTAYILNFTLYNLSAILLSMENSTTSGTFLSLYNNLSVFDYAPGKYFLNVSCSDGHTSAFFTDADSIKTTYNSLEYTFDKDIIKVEALSGDLQEITTEKTKDRYTFNIGFTKAVSSFQYKITANKIVPYDSKYPGHLILDDKYWFDTAPYAAHIDSIKDGVALVTVTVPNEDNLKTESLGGLNIASVIYNLTFRYYLPSVAANTAIVGQTNNLTIDFLNVSGMALNTSLFYNGVAYPLTSFNNSIGSSYTRVLFSFIPITASTASASYYFNYSYSAGGAVSYYGNTTNFTQDIFNAALLPCNPGDTNTSSLNLSFYDESSLAPLNVSGQAIIESWIDDPAAKINNTFNWSFKQNYLICIYPNTASMHINAYIKYNSSYTHRYYINSGNLSNTSQNPNLYNFESSTGVSLLNGVARDYTSYNFLENIYAKLLRYYPSENLWRIVQMDKSDTYGQMVFHVIEQSQDYKMVFEYNSAQIGETSEMKFVCTAGICSLTFPLSLTSTTSDTFTSSLSFDNITGVFTLVFNEATGESHNVWLQVSHKIGTVDNLVCNNSLNAASGSILCNIANTTGMFTAIGYKQTLTTPIDYLDIDRPAGKLWQFASAYRNDLVLLAGGVLVTATMAGAMMGAGLGLIGAGVGIIAIFAIGFINLPVGIFAAILLILILILFKVEI